MATLPDIDRRAQQEHLNAVCERGLGACRRGDWKAGMVDLAWLVKGKQAKQLPSQCYSYLGYGTAHLHGDVAKGRRLCRHAVKLEWFQPENYYNLARTCMLSPRYRQEAVDAVHEGLKVDPDHSGLRRLRDEVGERRPPVVTFLSRRNILNRILGRLRHLLRQTPKVATTSLEEPSSDGLTP